MFMGTRLQSAMETLFSKPRSSAPSRSPRVKVLLGIRFESLSPWKMCWPLQAEVDFRQTTELACGAGSKPVKYCLYIYMLNLGMDIRFWAIWGFTRGTRVLTHTIPIRHYHRPPPFGSRVGLGWPAFLMWICQVSWLGNSCDPQS